MYMKILSLITIGLVLLCSNISSCSQENSTVEITEMDIIEYCIFVNWELKERKEATKKFVRKQFKKGYPLEEIQNQVWKLARKTKEMKAYEQFREEQNYGEEEHRKLQKLEKIAENTPENRIGKKLSKILNIDEKEISSLLREENKIEEKIKTALQRKQKIEEEIKKLSNIEQEFFNSLLQ